jgi:hypothetical protein
MHFEIGTPVASKALLYQQSDKSNFLLDPNCGMKGV